MGRINLPRGARVDIASATLRGQGNVRVKPSADGSFGPIAIPWESPCEVTAIFPTSGEKTPFMAVSGLYISGDKTIEIDCMNDALVSVWRFLKVHSILREGLEAEDRERLLSLPEVRALGDAVAERLRKGAARASRAGASGAGGGGGGGAYLQRLPAGGPHGGGAAHRLRRRARSLRFFP